jgi:membrane fusion protein (multidrug efflux system)
MSTPASDSPSTGRSDSSIDHDNEARKQPNGFLHRPAVLITGAVVLALILAGAFLWWRHSRQFETTDDAFIDTRIVRVSPRISGQVIAVHVEDNQLVHVGDVLVDIDPADSRAMLDQMLAQQSQAQTVRRDLGSGYLRRHDARDRGRPRKHRRDTLATS